MLDLVPEFSLKQTFLEPACGNGNFLIEILRRKLQAHAATRPYFERDSNGRLAPFPSGKEMYVYVLQTPEPELRERLLQLTSSPP